MKRLIGLLLISAVLLGCSQTKTDSQGKSSTGIEEASNVFEFDGNYLPTAEFKIKDYLLKSIEIGTDDSLKGNRIKLIYIRFSNLATDDYHVITNTKFEGTKDRFSVTAIDSVLGKIQISGSFFGQRGPINDNIKDPSTIVFKGLISADGINGEKIECTYFEGD
jgi:hypothetical protein